MKLLQDLLKSNGYRYTAPEVPQGGQVAKPPEAQAVPGLPTPEQMKNFLLSGGKDAVDLSAYATRLGQESGVDVRRQLLPIRSAEATDASQIRQGEREHGMRTYGEVTKDLQNNTFGQASAVAREIAALNQGTTGAVSTAIGGEQANDAARLQLMRDVLMKPKSFGQTLGELTSAIAPIAALFV